MENSNPKIKKEIAKTADEIINKIYDEYGAEADMKLFGGKKIPKSELETAPEAPSRADDENKKPAQNTEPKETEDKTLLSEAFGKINKQNEDTEEEKEQETTARPEEKNIMNEKRDKRLLELGKELEAARREYVLKDYNMDKNSSFFKKILGIGKRSQLKELNAEYKNSKKRYEEILKKFKDATVEDLVSDLQEAEITSSWLEKGEFIELQKIRDQIKLENTPWSQGIKGGCVKLVEDYRKLPAWKKIAIGFGVIGTVSIGGMVVFGGHDVVEKVMENFSGAGGGEKSTDKMIEEYHKLKNIKNGDAASGIMSQEKIGVETDSAGSDMTNDNAISEQMENRSGNESLNEKAEDIATGEITDDVSHSARKSAESGTDAAAVDTIPIPLEKIHATAYKLRSGITNADKNLWDSVADKNLWDSVADKDLWDSVKNMTYEEIHNQSDSRLAGVNQKLDEMRVQYAEKFGSGAEPMSGETLAQYTERLARLNNGNPFQPTVEIHNPSLSGSSLDEEDNFPAGGSADANLEKFSSDAQNTMEKFKSDANEKLERMKKSF